MSDTDRLFADGLSFLVVEDDAMIAMMTEMLLADAGAKDVGIAASVAEAMALLDDNIYDVAIFDRQLGDGISYSAAIRACHAGTVIIVATGSSHLDLPAELAEAVPLSKPFEATKLERAVAMALSKRRRG